MNPELVKKTDTDHGDNHGRIEAQQGQPQPEQEFVQTLSDTLPQRSTEVEVAGRVMIDMSRPEQAHFMITAMKPVVTEIIEDK